MINYTNKKYIKTATLCVVAAAAFALGIYLEFYRSESFTITSIPVKTENLENGEEYTSHYDENDRLDINYATAEELEKLYGIGEKTAERIIQYREEHGDFQAVEELMNVPGIGEKMLDDFKDDICVR